LKTAIQLEDQDQGNSSSKTLPTYRLFWDRCCPKTKVFDHTSPRRW